MNKKDSSPEKGGGGVRKVLLCLEGGGGKQFQTHNFPILEPPPLPIINDRSLRSK